MSLISVSPHDFVPQPTEATTRLSCRDWLRHRGWLMVQIAATVLPAFHAPDGVLPVLIVLLGVGFPLALVLAWAFDVTPSGIEKTPEEEGTTAARNTMRRGDQRSAINGRYVPLAECATQITSAEFIPERSRAFTMVSACQIKPWLVRVTSNAGVRRL